MKMKKITVTVNGFHGQADITVMATEKEIEQGYQIINESKARRIDKQICGVQGCTCYDGRPQYVGGALKQERYEFRFGGK